MAAFIRLAFVVLICLMQRCNGQESRITFDPTKLSLPTDVIVNTGGNLTIKCEPPISGVGKLLVLQLSRRLLDASSSGTPFKVLVSATDGETKLVDSSVEGAVSGSIDDNYVQLSMRQFKCADQATYRCSATYLNTQSATTTVTVDKNFTVDVTPGQLEMSAYPPERQVWKVNETLTMQCTGSAGSVRDTAPQTPEVEWIWQYRYRAGVQQQPQDWVPYDGNSETDILTNDQSTQQCYVIQTSILTRRLRLDDTGRIYRCYVKRGYDYKEFAANHSVSGTVTLDGVIVDGGPDNEPSKANVGAIVGGLLGSLLVVAIILIIVYFLVIRPRRQRKAEEKYAAGGDEKGDGAELPPPADPSVIYSQPNRFRKDKTSEGMANKGLDASDNGKVPHDNDDKRHGRRHKDKKPAPEESLPPYDPTDPYVIKLDRNDGDNTRVEKEQRQGRRNKDDADNKPRSRRSGDDNRRGHDDDRHGHDNDRRGRRRREADEYDNKPTQYDDDHGRGHRNKGYDYDGNKDRFHHDSSDDGGTGSYVNTSQHSLGYGDPTMGTAI